MKTQPALFRPGAMIAAGIAAWPVMALSVANAAAVGGCVQARGFAGFIATHGALMRATSTCPSNSVGIPGVIDSAAGVFATAAIVTAVVHLLIAGVGSRSVEWAQWVAEAFRRAIALALGHAKKFANFRLPHVWVAQYAGQNTGIHVPWRRGPPAWGHWAS